MDKRPVVKGYAHLANGVSTLLVEARRSSARTVNAVITAAYWSPEAIDGR